jgi:hypothetical protein
MGRERSVRNFTLGSVDKTTATHRSQQPATSGKVLAQRVTSTIFGRNAPQGHVTGSMRAPRGPRPSLWAGQWTSAADRPADPPMKLAGNRYCHLQLGEGWRLRPAAGPCAPHSQPACPCTSRPSARAGAAECAPEFAAGGPEVVYSKMHRALPLYHAKIPGSPHAPYKGRDGDVHAARSLDSKSN